MLGWALNLGFAGGEATLTYQTGDAQAFAATDLPEFFDIGGLASADSAHFLDLDMGFGESVFLASTEMAGIFDDHSTAGGDRDGPRVMLLTSDIDDNSIDQGSVLTIRSRTFHVAGVQRDGTGVSTVVLVEPS